jgi:hypothetical protein
MQWNESHSPTTHLLHFMYSVATDILLFRRWRNLATKKRKEAQKQIPILFSSKISSIIYKFTLCSILFCLWDFFVWFRIVFSSWFNNIVNSVDIYPCLFFSLVFRIIRHFRLSDRRSVPFRSDSRDSNVFSYSEEQSTVTIQLGTRLQ